MKLARLISDVLVGHNSVFNNDQIHIINPKVENVTNFTPICKRTVAYIVGIVLLDDDNQICLVEEAKETCKHKWYLPAGRMEMNETLAEAAIREAKEETGYSIEPICLTSVEIDELGLWYRFTFLAKIIGGTLKSVEQADSESLQAKWFNLKELKKNSSLSFLRSLDFLKVVDIAVRYYQRYNINSMTKLTDPEFLHLKLKYNLILPSLNAHKNLLFTFVILNEEFTKCLLYETTTKNASSSSQNSNDHDDDGDETTSNLLLPSLIMVPDIYLKYRQHCFDYAVQHILLPFCFQSPKRFHYKSRGIVAVDYNGHANTNSNKNKNDKPESKDGIQFIFLINIFQEKRLEEHDCINLDEYKPNPFFKWHSLVENENQFIDKIKANIDNPTHFITLLLNY